MIKLKLILLFMLLCPLIGNSQNSIQGKINNLTTNANFEGVSVYFPELKKGVISNQNGQFEISNLPKGKFILEVKFIGYESIVQLVNVAGTSTYNFELKEAIAELHEVVATGIGRATELKLNPVIIKSVDNLFLRQNAATNLIDALKSVPGISQLSTGAAISKPLIRGLGYNRVITLFNGVRQEGQQWGDEHGIEIDEYTVDRIEIVKGPGSFMYGSDGIAGVMNFISENALPNGEIKTSYISNFQTNNYLFSNSIANSGSKNSFQWMGRITNKNAMNYSNRFDGKIYNSGFSEIDGSLMLGINKSWGFSHLSMSAFNQKIAIPEGERDSLGRFTKEVNDNGILQSELVSQAELNDFQIGFPFQKISHHRVVSNSYYVLENGTISLDLAFQQNIRKEFANILVPSETDLHFVLNTYNYNLKYAMQKIKGWESTVGINGMAQSNRNKGVELIIPEYNLVDLGLYFASGKSLTEKIQLSFAARIDNRILNSKRVLLDQNDNPISIDTGNFTVKFSSLNRTWSNFSGAVGFAYIASPRSNFKFNLSRGYRAANISELTSNGKHEGAFRYEYGDPNLNAEFSHQIDFAYYFNSAHLSIEASPFINFISNYIYPVKLLASNGADSIPDLSDPTPAYKYTQGDARLWGGELLIDLHPHPIDWLHFENGFSFVNAFQFGQTDSTKYLPFIPSPHYRLEIRAQFKKVGTYFKNCYLKFNYDHFFAQNRIYSAYGTERESSSYSLIGAGLGMDLAIFKSNRQVLSFLVSADNLADLAFQNHLSRLRYAPTNPATGRQGIFNMGRNISFKLYLTI